MMLMALAVAVVVMMTMLNWFLSVIY